MAEQAQPGTIEVDIAPLRRLAKSIQRQSRELVQEVAKLEPAVETMADDLSRHEATLKEYGITTERKDA